jgi:tRNA-dihydrouridine synthase 1
LSNPAIFLPPDHKYFHPSVFLLANRYLDIVESLKVRTSPSAVKSHLFRMLKPALDVDESIRELIGRTPMFADSGLDAVRNVIKTLEEKLQGEIKAAGSDWKAPPIDPVTGYRKLPPFVVQPVIRTIPESTEVGGHEEFEPEEGAINGKSAPPTAPSTPPAINTAAKCIHSAPTPCAAVAAGRCETKACLIHCRLMRAVAGGMDPEEANHKSARGELVGMGCESHESKVRARGDRMAEKRKHKAEAKQEGKRRKMAKA